MRHRLLLAPLPPVLLLVLVATATPALAQGAPHLLAPRDRGVVLGDSVEVVVEEALAAPDAFVDGAPITTAWTPLPYEHTWVARLPLAAPGAHTLEVSVQGGPAATASFESRTGAGLAVDLGDSVARHFLARHPARKLAWSWGPAVFLYGLERHARGSPLAATWDAALSDFCTARTTAGLPKIDRPDVCAPALGALALFRDLGDPAGLSGARKVAHYLETEKRDSLGAIDHLGSKSSARFWANLSGILSPWAHSIWCDSLMMYATFAVQWGASQNDTVLRDFGAAQPGIFAAKLQDPQTGLFAHAWDESARQPLGAVWLRGNGWVGTSIVEMLSELPQGHPSRPELERVLRDLAAGLAAEQEASGLWDSLVDSPGASYEESSGSALAAYALAKGARLGVLGPDARARARHAFAALTARLARRHDGDLSVTGTSGATDPTPAWIYALVPQEDDVDYGAGAYLLLASELAAESW